MAMYTKDKPYRLTLRLTEDQFLFLKANSDQLDTTPSDFLRMVINNALVTARRVQSGVAPDVALRESVLTPASEKGTVEGRENDDTNQHHLV